MSLFNFFDTVKGELALAGLAGSAVSVIMEWEGFIPGIRRLFVGTVTAFFLGPVGIPMFSWAFGQISIPQEHSASVGGFLMGITGVVLVEIILRMIKLRKQRLDDTDE